MKIKWLKYLIAASVLISISILEKEGYSEVKKNILIHTIPSGVEIYKVVGNKETLIGKTPLSAAFDFHSDISIVRIRFKKIGYRDKTIKITSKDEEINVSMDSVKFMKNDPKGNASKEISSLHDKIEKTLNNAVINANNNASGYKVIPLGYQLSERENKKILIVELSLKELADGVNIKSLQGRKDFVLGFWDHVGSAITAALFHERIQNKIDADLLFDLEYSELGYGAKFNPGVQSTTEMVCMPGTKMGQVYDSCANKVMVSRTIGSTTRFIYECRPGFVSKPVADPCAYKMPRTKLVTTVKAKYEFKKEGAHLIYISQCKNIGGQYRYEHDIKELDISLTNSENEILYKQGNIN